MNLIKSALAQIGGTGDNKTWTEISPGKEGGGFFGGGSTWGEILTNITNIIFLVAGIVAFIYLLYSGFVYLTAGGNPDAAKKGQQGLLNAIIGLVIIFLAYGIVRFVTNFLSSQT